MAEHIVLAKPQTGTCVYMAVDDQVRGNAITDNTPVFRFILRTFPAVCIDISGDCIVVYCGRAESKLFSKIRFPSFPAEKCYNQQNEKDDSYRKKNIKYNNFVHNCTGGLTARLCLTGSSNLQNNCLLPPSILQLEEK